MPSQGLAAASRAVDHDDRNSATTTISSLEPAGIASARRYVVQQGSSPECGRRHATLALARRRRRCSPHCRRTPRCSAATRSTRSPTASSWVVLCIVPIVAIALFWIVHVLPEKIAHKRHHPQTRRDPDAVPAVAGLRRPAVADRLAVGLHQADRLPLAYGTDKHEDYHLEMAEKAAPARSARAELAHLRDELDAMSARGALPPELTRAARAARRACRCRDAPQAARTGERLMDILILGIYAVFVWLIFFKFKWLPWNTVSQVIVIIIPIVGADDPDPAAQRRSRRRPPTCASSSTWSTSCRRCAAA